MGILSWFKNMRRREDAAEIQRAQDEYFDTPQERRIESGDIEGLQADYQTRRSMREDTYESGSGSVDAEERLAEEEER